MLLSITSDMKKVERLNTSLSTSLQLSTRGIVQLPRAADAIADALHEFKASNSLQKLGMVVGMVTSDGPKERPANEERLRRYTRILRMEHAFPMFSCMDIYDRDFLNRFDAIEDVKAWDSFWERILAQKSVTDMFMTPRWEESYGAKVEFAISNKVGIALHMADRDPALLAVMLGVRSDSL